MVLGDGSAYLRVSVTDRCNLNCAYCRPVGSGSCALAEGLSAQDLALLVRAIGHALPIRKFRITGGEPLLVPGLPGWIAGLRRDFAEAEFCLTTNGVFLAQRAKALKDAGLDRVNVSLDTLEPESFREVTGTGLLSDVLNGVRVATEAGFPAPKLNTVLLREYSGRQLPALTRAAHRSRARIRFIELMPAGPGADRAKEQFLSADEAIGLLSEEMRYAGPLPAREGTARLHRFFDGNELIDVGFIAPVSEPFCDSCDRLRLDCRGRLYSCLRDEVGMDLRALSGTGAPDLLRDSIRSLFHAKAGPARRVPPGMPSWPRRPMSVIGG